MEKPKCGVCGGKGYIRVVNTKGGYEMIYCRVCRKPKGRLITVAR